MCLCMRSLLALVFMILFSSIPLNSHVSPMCSQPSISPKCSLDAPIDNPKICDSNVGLGHENNEFNVLGGNVDDYLSLSYLRGYDLMYSSLTNARICKRDSRIHTGRWREMDSKVTRTRIDHKWTRKRGSNTHLVSYSLGQIFLIQLSYKT